ncbi:bifunctional (p)ppGpp synthetase/guanosine-3',5'-bis(diphosphate) 3'-pyrophosphohydrolase [Mailhella massiliensis]|uniref:Bifunctional (P)ppGpp synthetase/guanosine-3',5'-bis(Diphosphate) 3'-pyrophosphohydrolase n=1 Tax=Mailhella massiliensis TaxID=1903261 RepID=A0A921DSM4_9BACT|nr:bifunctional (p)ppGpp synthetase/guanosine-3',5'-bis(diphosphate) 3'-pyrophosphohydrolase [Mailhella massiliensis]HJD98298.1 bifunctional (p)ppGpp synthetase/guanosine-3',5'-bis(diphosphate) 3'-pyrophosphohydrolase [Mailhella massiliensis]
MVISPVTGESSPASKVPSADEIVEQLLTHYPDADAAMVRRAYDYASAAHAGQLRLSGDPYILHPASVALTLAKMGFDEHAVAAGLLHDTVEDTDSSIDELDELFGEQVADIVDGVTKITMMSFDTKEEAQAENIRKMILSMAHDIRVPVVKLADRLHNMSTLDFQKPHKQQRIAKETMDIYAPLANRLGLHLIKQKLEDLSFRYLQPDAYTEITTWLTENQIVERQLISKVIGKIEAIMTENRINGRVFGRIKQTYSIYRKMMAQKTPLDEMHDIIAFRVIVNDLRDCYAMLGLVHVLWKPVPGRFKDYISMPKANGYQSLHTTVIGPEGERIEIQIRTEEMNNMAEHGVAAHWMYKERNHAIAMQDMPQFQWLRDLMERQRDEADSREFMSSLRMDLFNDEIYVFTPRGAVKRLPKGATSLDFAFLIHSDVGAHCVGAKINGKLEPFATPLKNGDMVEIITDKNRHPHRDWLKIVKTAKARSRIQHYLRTEERVAAVALGRELLEKEGRKMDFNVVKAAKDGRLQLVLPEFSLNTLDDLFASVGTGRLTPKKVLQKLDALLNPRPDAAALEAAPTPAPKAEVPSKKPVDGITIKGIEDTLIHFAKCCKPVPGDQVVGFISRGRGVIVHTANCPHVQNLESERLISVNWNNEESKPFPAEISIMGLNEKGLLAKISLVFVQQDVNINALQIKSTVDGRSQMDFTVEVRDAVHLYQTIDKLRTVEHVLEVRRGTSIMDI